MQNELSKEKQIIFEFSRGCNKIAIHLLVLMMKEYQFDYRDTQQHHHI